MIMNKKLFALLIPVVLTGCGMAGTTPANSALSTDPGRIIRCRDTGVGDVIGTPAERKQCDLIVEGHIDQISYKVHTGIVTADIQFSIDEVLQGTADQETISVHKRQGMVKYMDYVDSWPEAMTKKTLQAAKEEGIVPESCTYLYLENGDFLLSEGDQCLFGLMKSDKGYYYMQDHINDSYIDLEKTGEFASLFSAADAHHEQPLVRDEDTGNKITELYNKEQVVDLLNNGF